MAFLYNQKFWVPTTVFLIYLTAVITRPLLPVDETRYLTVAWEMYLQKNWFLLTMNFEPYHHKPPLLFWLINICWQLFGVSRWAATLPVIIAAIGCIFLTQKLASQLFPQIKTVSKYIPVLMIGSVPFLIYSTMVMFDILLTFFILCVLVHFLSFAAYKRYRNLLLAGLFLGLGVLTKGPVAYLHVIFPMLAFPFWRTKDITFTKLQWYGFFALSLLISIIPVLLWLLPTLRQADGHFAFWLIWEQTAGRVTGNFKDAHVRPVYFYLLILPILFLPWVFLPQFWRKAETLKTQFSNEMGIRFLAFWLIPAFTAFSLVSGKQPHYLVPLLPGIVILIGYLLNEAPLQKISQTSFVMLVLLLGLHVIGKYTLFPKYDLQRFADYVSQHQDRDWAYNRNYSGEINFLGRLNRLIISTSATDLSPWFKTHPEGLAIVRYKYDREIAGLTVIFSQDYKGKKLGIFCLKSSISCPSERK